MGMNIEDMELLKQYVREGKKGGEEVKFDSFIAPPPQPKLEAVKCKSIRLPSQSFRLSYRFLSSI